MPDPIHSMALSCVAHKVLTSIQEALSLSSFTALMRLTFEAMDDLAGKVCEAPPGGYGEPFTVLRLTMPDKARRFITEWGGEDTAGINVWTSLRRMLEQVARDEEARTYYIESVVLVMKTSSMHELERLVRTALAATGITRYEVGCYRHIEDPIVELTTNEYELLSSYAKRMDITIKQAIAYWLGTSSARNEHKAWRADQEPVVIIDPT